MNNPADLSVLIYTPNSSIARTMRMALRGAGVRTVHLAGDETQLMDGFQMTDPTAAVVYIDRIENDPGFEMLRFLRRSPRSPNVRVPVIIASQSREVSTITAVINAGAHEYVLFPASGDTLAKKAFAASATNRPWIEAADYIGPCRRRRLDQRYRGPERRAATAAKAETQVS
jgi:two-component system, chemotaxis family, chemotaxis protein CheY